MIEKKFLLFRTQILRHLTLFILFTLVSGNLFGQQVSVKLSLRGTALEVLAGNLISEQIQKLSATDLAIDSSSIEWKDHAIFAEASIRYKKDTGLFGLVVTISGTATTKWIPVWNESGFTLRRQEFSFRNNDPSMKAFDGVISLLAENKIPSEFSIPRSRLEDDLIRIVSKAQILDLKLAVNQASVTEITSDSAGMYANIDILGTLFSADIQDPDPNGGVHVSAAWMKNQLEQTIRQSKSVRLDSATVQLNPESWMLQTRLRIPFKWFWIIPDEMPRTVIATIQPAVQNSNLVLSFKTVDVYDKKPGEFSLINWYLRSRVESELNRYELPARLIPEETSIDYKGIRGRILIPSPVFESVQWTGNEVRLGFSMTVFLQF